MGKHASNILFLMVFLFCSKLTFAQPNTLYFMKGIPQTKDLNPARPGISGGFYFSMPLFSKLDLEANSNNWSYNDLIHKGTSNTSLNNTTNNTLNNQYDQSDSLVIDLDKFREKIGNSNFGFEAAALTVLEAGYKKGKNFYAFSLTERQFVEGFFNKTLVDITKLGNYPYVGETFYSGNFGIGAQHYREFAFNYSHDATKKLTLGAAAKILFGMGAIQTNGMNFKVASPANGEYLDVSVTGRVNLSVPISFNYTPIGDIYSMSSLPDYKLQDYLLNFQNSGIAVDMGFAYMTNKKTELSMSVIDLGIIGWKSNVTQLTEHGNFFFQGININDPTKVKPLLLKPIIDQLHDSIVATFRPDNSGKSFSTILPVKVYLGIDYKLNDAISLSGLSRIRIISSKVHTSLTVSANTLIANALSLSASYSIMESTFDNIGLGIGIKAGLFQIYAAADNFVSPFYPTMARNMNLRIGINFVFKDTSKSKIKGGESSSKLNPNCNCPY